MAQQEINQIRNTLQSVRNRRESGALESKY